MVNKGGLQVVLEDREKKIFVLEDRGALDAFRKKITTEVIQAVDQRKALERKGRSRLDGVVLY